MSANNGRASMTAAKRECKQKTSEKRAGHTVIYLCYGSPRWLLFPCLSVSLSPCLSVSLCVCVCVCPFLCNTIGLEEPEKGWHPAGGLTSIKHIFAGLPFHRSVHPCIHPSVDPIHPGALIFCLMCASDQSQPPGQ